MDCRQLQQALFAAAGELVSEAMQQQQQRRQGKDDVGLHWYKLRQVSRQRSGMADIFGGLGVIEHAVLPSAHLGLSVYQ
jgi:hypothetical protein